MDWMAFPFHSADTPGKTGSRRLRARHASCSTPPFAAVANGVLAVSASVTDPPEKATRIPAVPACPRVASQEA